MIQDAFRQIVIVKKPVCCQTITGVYNLGREMKYIAKWSQDNKVHSEHYKPWRRLNLIKVDFLADYLLDTQALLR